MCQVIGGCLESNCDQPWPPPLDDRVAWTGEGPGEKECREFGWYARIDPRMGWVPCGPDNFEAVPDLNRLVTEAEWDRVEKRWVRTTLTEAIAEMMRRGIEVSPGRSISTKVAVAELNARAVHAYQQGISVLGYAFYTFRGKEKKLQGKDFALHFGEFDGSQRSASKPSVLEVGELVCDCLSNNGVQHTWNRAADRRIRIIAASISHLS